MARGPIPYIVQKTNGDAVSGATISVNIRGGGPATIYAGETGSTLASAPLLTDVDGKVTAWLDEGSYDVTASGASITTTTRALEVLRGDATSNRLVSPSLTGTPGAPTAPADTNTTQLATTAFVVGQAATVAPIIEGTATVGTSLRFARQDHIHPEGKNPGASARIGPGGLTINSGNDTLPQPSAGRIVKMATEVFDTDATGMYDPTTGFFTFQKAGIYLYGARIRLSAVPAGGTTLAWFASNSFDSGIGAYPQACSQITLADATMKILGPFLVTVPIQYGVGGGVHLRVQNTVNNVTLAGDTTLPTEYVGCGMWAIRLTP